MPRPYSNDLCERVVASVEKGGLSRREAAIQFEVNVSSAIAWVWRFRETRNVASGRMGDTSRRRSEGPIAIGQSG